MARSRWKYGKRSRRTQVIAQTIRLEQLRESLSSTDLDADSRKDLLAEASALGGEVELNAASMYRNRNRRRDRVVISKKAANLMLKRTVPEPKPWDQEVGNLDIPPSYRNYDATEATPSPGHPNDTTPTDPQN